MNSFLFFGLKISIVVLVIIIYIFYNRTHKPIDDSFPPWKSKCPDLWEILDNKRCRNTHKIGSCSIMGDMVMDFNEPIFKTEKADYFKCKWSKECGVAWEGIDNLCI
jgi:hypothetical protein